MPTACGIVGGKTFYCDGTAGPDGDGSESAPWNNIDEAIQNITTYQKNMNTYIYLNIRGSNGNVPYPVTESISYLSDFTLRSYGDWSASPPVPEATRPRLVFTGATEHINHCDNWGTNSIEIISGSIGALEALEIRYSYIGLTDTDVSANLKLVNTRLTTKTQFKPNVNFTGPSTTSTIELTKGSVLIALDSWNLNGLLPSSDLEPIFYNGGVLISNRISNYATAKEPSVNEYAIGYYNPASLKINIPDDQHKNIPNQVLIWDAGGSGAPSASFREIDSCESIGCSAAPEIEYYSFSHNEGDHFLAMGGLLRVKTPTMKKLYLMSQSVFIVQFADVSLAAGTVPERFRPKNTVCVCGIDGLSQRLDQWIDVYPTGGLRYFMTKIAPPGFGNNGMCIQRDGEDVNKNITMQWKEIVPLNNL